MFWDPGLLCCSCLNEHLQQFWHLPSSFTLCLLLWLILLALMPHQTRIVQMTLIASSGPTRPHRINWSPQYLWSLSGGLGLPFALSGFSSSGSSSTLLRKKIKISTSSWTVPLTMRSSSRTCHMETITKARWSHILTCSMTRGGTRRSKESSIRSRRKTKTKKIKNQKTKLNPRFQRSPPSKR